jgi:hypothetical protein
MRYLYESGENIKRRDEEERRKNIFFIAIKYVHLKARRKKYYKSGTFCRSVFKFLYIFITTKK